MSWQSRPRSSLELAQPLELRRHHKVGGIPIVFWLAVDGSDRTVVQLTLHMFFNVYKISIFDATMSPFFPYRISFVERTSFPSQTSNMIRLWSLQSSPAPALHQHWLAKPIVWGRCSLNQASAAQFRKAGEYYEDLDKVRSCM
jgi:hypothetical protein